MKLKLWELILFVLIPISMICGNTHAQEGKIWYEGITPQEYVDLNKLYLPDELKAYLDNLDPEEVLVPALVETQDEMEIVVVSYIPKKLAEIEEEICEEIETAARATFCTCEYCRFKEDGTPLYLFEIYSEGSGWINVYNKWEIVPKKKSPKGMPNMRFPPLPQPLEREV